MHANTVIYMLMSVCRAFLSIQDYESVYIKCCPGGSGGIPPRKILGALTLSNPKGKIMPFLNKYFR